MSLLKAISQWLARRFAEFKRFYSEFAFVLNMVTFLGVIRLNYTAFEGILPFNVFIIVFFVAGAPVVGVLSWILWRTIRRHEIAYHMEDHPLVKMIKESRESSDNKLVALATRLEKAGVIKKE